MTRWSDLLVRPIPFFDSLIFDLDGTFWHTTDACVIAWNQVIQRHRIPFREISPADISAVTGMVHEQSQLSKFSSHPMRGAIPAEPSTPAVAALHRG
jgi:beta-phosphoglucomutase-like phosphatase (HAD superfamily)